MNTYYKATNENHQSIKQTYSEDSGYTSLEWIQWGPRITHTDGELPLGLLANGDRYTFVYKTPGEASFFWLKRFHQYYQTAVLWLAEGPEPVCGGPPGCGVTTLTTLEIVPMPEITTEQRVEIARRCCKYLGYDLSCRDMSRWSAKQVEYWAARVVLYAIAENRWGRSKRILEIIDEVCK